MKPETEIKLREYLWMSHGHTGQYGDDGEMQCSECMRYGLYDYKREDLEKIILVAIKARYDVNLHEILKRQKDAK